MAIDELIDKRTTGLMQPQLAPRIEAATRKEFPNGIAAHGTDALRFTFASLATQGRDIRFDLGRIEGYRNFCNKLWNAARFVLMNTAGERCGQDGDDYGLGAAERWIIARLQQTEAEVAEAIEQYRFDRMTQAIYVFIWDEYCSWYLELSKITLADEYETTERKVGTRRTLVRVLESALRLLHPLMPFITETIWQKVAPLAGKNGLSIMTQPYPVADPAKVDEDALREIDWLQSVVGAVRNIRGEMNIAPTHPLRVLLQEGSAEDWGYLERNRTGLAALAHLARVDVLTGEQGSPDSATALVGQLKVLVPLDSAIDKDAELKRLGKQISKLEGDLTRSRSKLANPNFVQRAPADVVGKERERTNAMQTALEELQAQYEKIRALGPS